jgi:hypothetical protein
MMTSYLPSYSYTICSGIGYIGVPLSFLFLSGKEKKEVGVHPVKGPALTQLLEQDAQVHKLRQG